jgi:predicted transcriptional regulator
MIKPKQYGIIDKEVIRQTKLSLTARLVYAILCSYADEQHTCFVGNERLAEDLGRTEKTVSRAIKELKDHNIITREQHAHNGPSYTDIHHGPRFQNGEFIASSEEAAAKKSWDELFNEIDNMTEEEKQQAMASVSTWTSVST